MTRAQYAESDEDLKIFGDALAANFLSTVDLSNTFENLLEPLATISQSDLINHTATIFSKQPFQTFGNDFLKATFLNLQQLFSQNNLLKPLAMIFTKQPYKTIGNDFLKGTSNLRQRFSQSNLLEPTATIFSKQPS
jgi:hypothetical protein